MLQSAGQKDFMNGWVFAAEEKVGYDNQYSIVAAEIPQLIGIPDFQYPTWQTSTIIGEELAHVPISTGKIDMWTIFPDLPPGLQMDPNGRIIGAPVVASPLLN